jgi:hypothetical protein
MTGERLQLGRWEFDSVSLDAPTLSLPQTWAGHPVLPLQPVDWARLPPHGWRLISARDDNSHSSRHVVLAAPTGTREGTASSAAADPLRAAPAAPRAWWVAVMSWRGDHWEAASEPEPLPLRPDKATRRRGLSLRWPSDALVVRRGETLHAVIHLTNDGPRDWYEPDDPLTVVTVILDASTLEAMPSERWTAYAPLRTPAAHLPVGGVIELPADIDVRADRVPSGRHLVRASVIALDLDSLPVPLTIA